MSWGDACISNESMLTARFPLFDIVTPANRLGQNAAFRHSYQRADFLDSQGDTR